MAITDFIEAGENMIILKIGQNGNHHILSCHAHTALKRYDMNCNSDESSDIKQNS